MHYKNSRIRTSSTTSEANAHATDLKLNNLPPNFTEQQQKWLKSYLEKVILYLNSFFFLSVISLKFTF